jgi:hypothetical protein
MEMIKTSAPKTSKITEEDLRLQQIHAEIKETLLLTQKFGRQYSSIRKV